MKKYTVQVNVDQVEGYQCWEVEAESEKEALQNYARGEIIINDIDVTATSCPEIIKDEDNE